MTHARFEDIEQLARGSADAARADRPDAHRDRSRARAPRRRARFAGVAGAGDAVDGARGQGVRHRNGGVVTELAMRTCGGAAFGGAHGIERLFRDARAPIVMAPTSDSRLRVHRPRAVRPGGVLMARPLKVGAVMYDPKVSVIWEIIRDFFERRGRRSTSRSTRPTRMQVDGAADRRDRHRLELAARLGRRAAAIRRHLPRHRHARHRSRPRLVLRRAARRAGAKRSRTCEGRTLATGAIDSPQATLIPLGRLRREGLRPGVRRHGPALRRPRRQARRSRRRRARRVGCLTQGDAAAARCST